MGESRTTTPRICVSLPKATLAWMAEQIKEGHAMTYAELMRRAMRMLIKAEAGK